MKKNERMKLSEIKEFWCLLEKQTQKYRKYFAALATIPPKINTQARPKFQYSNSSDTPGDNKNA